MSHSRQGVVKHLYKKRACRLQLNFIHTQIIPEMGIFIAFRTKFGDIGNVKKPKIRNDDLIGRNDQARLSSFEFDFADFSTAKLPSLVILMPKCSAIFSNEAYKKYSGSPDIIVPTTADEAHKLIEISQNTSEKIIHPAVNIDLLLPIDAETNIYASIDAELKQSLNMWHSAFAFQFVNQPNQRFYRADRLFGRFINPHVSQFKGHLLQVHYANLKGIEVEVSGPHFSDEESKAIMFGTIKILGTDIKIDFHSYCPPSPCHQNIDLSILEAIDKLQKDNFAQIKASIAESSRFIDIQSYKAISAMLMSLFNENYRIATVRSGLLQLRTRFFDPKLLFSTASTELSNLFFSHSSYISGKFGNDLQSQEGGAVIVGDDSEPFFPTLETIRLKRIINEHGYYDKLGELLKNDSGSYVAMYDGHIVDKDKDQISLAERTAKLYEPTYLMIRQVLTPEEVEQKELKKSQFRRE